MLVRLHSDTFYTRCHLMFCCKDTIVSMLCRLIMISSYNIGKEKVFIEVARRTGRPVCVTAAKMAILRLEDWPWDVPFDDVFTCNDKASSVFAVPWNQIGDTWPYFRPNYANMEIFAQSYAPLHSGQEGQKCIIFTCRQLCTYDRHLHDYVLPGCAQLAHMVHTACYLMRPCMCQSTGGACRQGATSAIGFVPTGWVDSGKCEGFRVVEKEPWKIHLIPYSEHSSFPELQEFVTFLKPKQIIPTVGANGEEGEKRVRKMLEHFRHMVDTSSAKRTFLNAFGGSSSGTKESKASKESSNELQEPPMLLSNGAAAVPEQRQSGEGMAQDKHSPATSEAPDVQQADVPSGRIGPNEPIDLAEATEVQAATTAARAGTRSNHEPAGKPVPARANNSGGHGGAVQQLRMLLGSDVSYAEALRLLQASSGNVAVAANAFYDRAQPAALPSAAQQQAGACVDSAAVDAPMTSEPTNVAEEENGAHSRRGGASATVSKTASPGSKAAQAPGNGKGGQRRNSVGGKGSAAGKAKSSPAKATAAITSFFSRAGTAAEASRATAAAPAAANAKPASSKAPVNAMQAEEDLLAQAAGLHRRKQTGPGVSADELSDSDNDAPDVRSDSALADVAATDAANHAAAVVVAPEQGDDSGRGEGDAAAEGAEMNTQAAAASHEAAEAAAAIGLVVGGEASDDVLQNALLPVDMCASALSSSLCLLQITAHHQL